MNLISLFSGCGGLDLGFEKAGFKITWANEYDKTIWATYRYNHRAFLDTRSIIDIPSIEIPDCDGLIGGPPCQSWSEAGTRKGIEDKRGQLFFEFIRVLKDKKPKFFLAENVSGMLAKRHNEALEGLKNLFNSSGYDLFFSMLNANDYGVPQDRKRVFFVGFRKDLNIKEYQFPNAQEFKPTLSNALEGLPDNFAMPASERNYKNEKLSIPNHEYMTGGFSTIYLSRNRVRNFDEPSFTIQAGGRHAPIHPKAPQMEFVKKDKFQMKLGFEGEYRRLSVRECASIQTFPKDFIFLYDRVADGYKMVGNAVPVLLAKAIAKSIKVTLEEKFGLTASVSKTSKKSKLLYSKERS